jgi:hypothetical protein
MWFSARFLRYSIRCLIVVVLAIGGGLSCVVRQARHQHDAVATIESAGGLVFYDWYPKNGENKPGGPPWWAPQWLADRIGVDYFGHVAHVWLPGKPESVIVQLARFPQLERVNIGDSALSDAGIARLKGLTDLTMLYLQCTQVTDAGLANLSGLKNLQILDLSGTQVSDLGLAHLKRLTKLKWLSLQGTRVTETGVSDLKQARPGLTIDR